MKKLFLALFLVGILTSSTAFILHDNINISSKNKITQPTKNVNGNIQVAYSDADFDKNYNSIEDLSKDADIIIQGVVLNVSYFDYNIETYTKSQVKVTKSYSKNIKEGDVLTFTEIGGITTQKNFVKALSKKSAKFSQYVEHATDKPIKRVLCGADVMQPDQQVLLFATKSTILPENTYVPLGAFQGKFLINGTSISRIKNNDEKSIIPLNFNKTVIDKKIQAAIKSKY